jgi:hypothetical protein
MVAIAAPDPIEDSFVDEMLLSAVRMAAVESRQSLVLNSKPVSKSLPETWRKDSLVEKIRKDSLVEKMHSFVEKIPDQAAYRRRDPARRTCLMILTLASTSRNHHLEDSDRARLCLSAVRWPRPSIARRML